MISHDTDRPRALTYVRGYSLFYENEHPPSTNKNPPGFSPHYVQYAASAQYLCMYVCMCMCIYVMYVQFVPYYDITVQYYCIRTVQRTAYSVQYSDMDTDTVHVVVSYSVRVCVHVL